jgi:ankyrin repeat protein
MSIRFGITIDNPPPESEAEDPANAEQLEKNRALFHAARNEDVDRLKESLAAGAEIDWNNKEMVSEGGGADVGRVSCTGSIQNEFVAGILIHRTFSFSIFFQFKRTALHEAAFFNKIKAVDALISNGANLNARADFGFTALMYASCEGHAEVVSMLLEAGAQRAVQDEFGSTSRTNHHDNIASLLLRR